MQETRLDTARIRAARQVIDPIFLDTPLYRCEALEPDLGCAVSIKLETANPVRSFKGRGTELVASQLADNGSQAVVCASAGNLGQALAWSGRSRGLDVTVWASRFAPATKLDRIRAFGARLELVDADFDTARERAAEILLGLGMGCVFVPAMSTATQHVEPRDAGVAAAVVNAAQQIGGSVGTALLNTIATTATAAYLATRPDTPDTTTEALVHGFAVAAAWGAGILAAAAVLAAVLINASKPANVSEAARPSPRGHPHSQPAPTSRNGTATEPPRAYRK